MYSEKLEALISAALADGMLSEKDKEILYRNAQAEGIDIDEFEMVLEARLIEIKNAERERIAKDAPKSEKFGDVRKCPACGGIVAAFEGVCRDCGFEFTAIDANHTSQQLYDALSNETDIQKQKQIIETFPIPNSKADLLEFLTALKPRILDTNSEFTNSYIKKYAECIEKIKVAYVGDKQLQPFVDEYSKIQTQLQLRRVWTYVKKHPILTGFIILFLISLIPVRHGGSAGDSSIAEYKEEFVACILNEDAVGARVQLQKMGKNHYDSALDLIELYIKKGDVQAAIDVYEKLTPGHTAMYDLQWEYMGHGSNKKYEITAIKLIRGELIKAGDYDKVWEYSERSVSDANHHRNAKDYFLFMSDVVRYLCEEDRMQEARKFINTYSLWFSNNIDPLKNSDCDSEISSYSSYNSKESKARLLDIFDNYAE